MRNVAIKVRSLVTWALIALVAVIFVVTVLGLIFIDSAAGERTFVNSAAAAFKPVEGYVAALAAAAALALVAWTGRAAAPPRGFEGYGPPTTPGTASVPASARAEVAAAAAVGALLFLVGVVSFLGALGADFPSGLAQFGYVLEQLMALVLLAVVVIVAIQLLGTTELAATKPGQVAAYPGYYAQQGYAPTGRQGYGQPNDQPNDQPYGQPNDRPNDQQGQPSASVYGQRDPQRSDASGYTSYSEPYAGYAAQQQQYAEQQRQAHQQWTQQQWAQAQAQQQWAQQQAQQQWAQQQWTQQQWAQQPYAQQQAQQPYAQQDAQSPSEPTADVSAEPSLASDQAVAPEAATGWFGYDAAAPHGSATESTEGLGAPDADRLADGDDHGPGSAEGDEDRSPA